MGVWRRDDVEGWDITMEKFSSSVAVSFIYIHIFTAILHKEVNQRVRNTCLFNVVWGKNALRQRQQSKGSLTETTTKP